MDKLSFRLQYLESCIRHCKICGNWWGYTDLFCTACWKKHFNHQIKCKKSNIPARGICLWSWSKKNDVNMKRLIYSIKSSTNKELFNVLALQMSYHFLAFYKECIKDQKIIIIPAPPKKVDRKDHAYLLAHALTDYIKGDLIQPLLRCNMGSQKLKNQYERKKTTSKLKKGPLAFNPKNDVIIFVDDVVTTGSTVMGAYLALCKPQRFFYVGLAYKERYF